MVLGDIDDTFDTFLRFLAAVSHTDLHIFQEQIFVLEDDVSRLAQRFISCNGVVHSRSDDQSQMMDDVGGAIGYIGTKQIAFQTSMSRSLIHPNPKEIFR